MTTLTKNWTLLALCGVLDAIISLTYLLMSDAGELVTFHSWNGSVVFAGRLAVVAGVCTIAAGLLRSRIAGRWLLILNGAALVALGLIQCVFLRFPISFLTVAFLIIVMALSTGVLELRTARTRRGTHDAAGGWLLGFAGVVSIGFATAFLALGLRWIAVEPGSHSDLVWIGSYFAFSAISMLGLARVFQSSRNDLSLANT